MVRRQFILFPILLGVILLLTTANCSLGSLVPRSTPAPTSTPKVRGFALWELFIHLSDLSPACRFEHPPTELTYEDKAGAEEAFSTRFICDGTSTIGGYAMYRFRDSQAAVSGYRHVQREWFYNAFRITPYMTPDGMGYQSPVARQIRFACADFYDGYSRVRSRRCVTVGQYDEYVSAISFSVSPPEKMGDYRQLLERILWAIDERMEHHLTEDTSG